MSFTESEYIMKAAKRISWTLCAIAAATMAITSPAMAQQKRTDEPVQTIPAVRNIDPAKVELGKKLFFDPRLSKSGFISC
ncbi:cytochrome c peroxidase, partial [Arthrospira platensis SPKY1]|nr:cytochrome c peroxidase [Arthrospira platensis SPKY1]